MLGNRYFAVTDDILDGSTPEFRHVETELLLDIIKVTGPAFAADGKQTKEGPFEKLRTPTSDRSRSAAAFRKGKQLRRDGATFDQMVAGLLEDPDTADWTRSKGQANGQRKLKRIWQKTEANGPIIRVIAGELHTATKRWPGKFGQADKWNFCLRAARVPPITALAV